MVDRALTPDHVSRLEVVPLDFLIDGESMHEMLPAPDAVRDGCLGNGGYQRHEPLVKRMLLEIPSDLETGRVALYVCPQCGDIGCGAVTAVIEQTDEFFIWKDFGYEKNWAMRDDEPLFDLSGYENIGPFYFDKQQYREALTRWPTREPGTE
jgi:hypothetical protein